MNHDEDPADDPDPNTAGPNHHLHVGGALLPGKPGIWFQGSSPVLQRGKIRRESPVLLRFSALLPTILSLVGWLGSATRFKPQIHFKVIHV